MAVVLWVYIVKYPFPYSVLWDRCFGVIASIFEDLYRWLYIFILINAIKRRKYLIVVIMLGLLFFKINLKLKMQENVS